MNAIASTAALTRGPSSSSASTACSTSARQCRGVSRERRRDAARSFRPDLRLVRLADQLDIGSDRRRRSATRTRAPPRGRDRIDDRRRRGDADRLVVRAGRRTCAAAGSDTRSRRPGAGEGVRLVEDEEVEPCVGEQPASCLACEQQLELLHVREQDARLAAGVRISSREQTLLRRVDRRRRRSACARCRAQPA